MLLLKLLAILLIGSTGQLVRINPNLDCNQGVIVTGVGRQDYTPEYGKLNKLTGEIDNCAGQMYNSNFDVSSPEDRYHSKYRFDDFKDYEI